MIMKFNRLVIIFSLITAIAIASACPAEKADEDTKFLVYSDEAITFEYPDWPDASPEDNETFLLKSNGSSVFSAARYAAPSPLFIQGMKETVGAVFEGEYGYYKLDSGNGELNAITRVLYSDYATYTFTIATAGQPDKSLLSSAKRNRRTLNTKEGIGIMPIPANGDAAFLPQACREARSLGSDVISWYFFWAETEEDWTIAGCILDCLSHEGKSVVVMNIIHSNVLPEYPRGYKSFADPGFKEDFAEHSVELVKRYQPDYYFIGGEMDIYLDMHRDEIPAFKEVYDYAYGEIKQASPDTRVGPVFTYHYARDYDALDIIRTLATECDIIGYTVHPYEGDYLYSDVSRGLLYLNEVRDVVPGKPYAILETGWSSSTLLDSNEDKQAEFVHDYFSFVDTSDAEFVIWFSLHDQTDCSEFARVHLAAVPHLQLDEDYVEAFEEFMCSPGLKNPDGSPKKAWHVWKEYVQ